MNDQDLTSVLFCTDFSENASEAFEFALGAVSKRPGCKLFILHVMPEPDAQFWKGYLYDEGKNLEDSAKEALRRKVDEDYVPRIPGGVDYEAIFRTGGAAQQILDFIKEKKIGLAVIGRQGESALRSVFFGNVATKVVRHASCPVLVGPSR